MLRIQRLAAAALLLSRCALLCVLVGSAAVAQAVEPIAFEHATLVPMTEPGRVLRDQTLVIEGSRIIAVGPASTIRVPRNARRVDLSGQYVLPGLFDTHAHLLTPAWAKVLGAGREPDPTSLPDERMLLPFLASGVTAIQVMAGDEHALQLREDIRQRRLLGPAMVVNSPLIDGEPPVGARSMSWIATTPEQARAYVDRAKAAGYDRLKIYSRLPAAAYRALIVRAREVGMPVDGHVPYEVSNVEAIRGGQASLSHAAEMIHTTRAHASGDQAGPIDWDQVEIAAREAADRGVFVQTTQIVVDNFARLTTGEHAVLLRQPALRFVHPAILKFWRPDEATLQRFRSPGHVAVWGPAQARAGLRVLDILRRSGVPLVAGTDTFNPMLPAGVSLLDELELLVEHAGFSPLEVLQTATSNAARYLGLARKGTLHPGQDADLVVLRGNPLEDIRALRDLAGVSVEGIWLERSEIDRRMEDTARFYEAHRQALETFSAPVSDGLPAASR